MKTLSSLRVKAETIDNMKSAIKKYNEKNVFAISEAEFRRLSLELLSQLILQEKPLPVKIK